MKIKILKFVKKVIIILLHPSEISRLLKYQLNLASAIKLPIINTNEVGEIIKTIKEESVEKASLLKVYDLVVSGEVYFRSAKLDVIKYKNSTVFSSSDFILCQDGVVWEKFHMPQFTKLIPHDQDLLKVQNDQLFIKRPNHYVKVKVGYSLCGVHSNIWAHFIVQYLPKLYLIPDIIKTIGQNITIILPNYSDPQIHDIVYNYLQKINGIEILELNIGEVAICDTLYHVRNTAWLSEHVNYISPVDSIVPKFVADSLKENLLADFSFIDEDKNQEKNKNGDKLYIARSGGRNILNYSEVEEYFIKKGFVIVTPHKLTLYEKIKLFRNASIIVGPLSSGFTNVLFCNPGTKVLMFMNLQRIFEPYLGFYADNFNIDITAITGSDEVPNDPHSSYTIPLSKIKSACEELGI